MAHLDPYKAAPSLGGFGPLVFVDMSAFVPVISVTVSTTENIEMR